MYHAWCALEDYDISDEDKLAVLLASLLHGYFVFIKQNKRCKT